MLNSSRLVMDASNEGYWIEDEDFRVIKAYSASPRESETTLFLWKNNLAPFESQKTYGRVFKDSPFLENLRIVEGLIQRLQARRDHIRDVLSLTTSTNTDHCGYLDFSPPPVTTSNIGASNNGTNSSPGSFIERSDKGVSRVYIKNSQPRVRHQLMQPPTMNNVEQPGSFDDCSTVDIESISTEYASSTLPVDVDEQDHTEEESNSDSRHFFSSLEDDSLILSPPPPLPMQPPPSLTTRTSHESKNNYKHKSPSSVNFAQNKIGDNHGTYSSKNVPGSRRKNECGGVSSVKTNLLSDAFYHSTEVIDVDSPYHSQEENEEDSSQSLRRFESEYKKQRSERKTRGDSEESSLIKSLERSYTPVYEPSNERAFLTPLSSLYSKYFDSYTTSTASAGGSSARSRKKGEIQKLF